jgi:ABC-type transport system involved in multi-copper enzyme maturation permease subunit
LIRLIQFEIKKLRRSTYFKWLLLLLGIAILSFYAYVYANTISVETIIGRQQEKIFMTEQRIAEMKTKLENGIEEEDISEESIAVYEDFLTKDQDILNALEQQNWSEYFALLTTEFEGTVQTEQSSLLQVSSTYIWPTPYTTIALGDEYQWMQRYGIEPVFPVNWSTRMIAYDEELSGPALAPISNKHSSTGLYFSYELFGYMLTLFGVIYFLFLFSNIITKEGNYRNGPIQLLRTQPIKHYQIIFVKLVTILTLSIVIIAFIWGVAMLLGMAFHNSGDWYYPVGVYGENQQLTFMAMGQFLVKSFGLFIMLLLFSYSLLFLYSILANRALIALGLTVITLFLGIWTVTQSFSYSFTKWIPFHYVNVFQIVTNEYALLHDQFSISYVNGVISLLTASVIVLLLTLIVSKLKQGVVR